MKCLLLNDNILTQAKPAIIALRNSVNINMFFHTYLVHFYTCKMSLAIYVTNIFQV